jgi:hypothetical protein
MSDRRASAEVNGEKLEELNDDSSLVFTKAEWFKGAASVFPDARGKSCGLKMFMSQGKRPVALQPLAAVAPVAACLYFRNGLPIWQTVTNRPGFERSHFSVCWQ